MTIELLMRERAGRKLIPSGITFSSITEAMHYYMRYVEEKFEPYPDMLGGKFKILDSNELFSVNISWNNRSEICGNVQFEGLDKETTN